MLGVSYTNDLEGSRALLYLKRWFPFCQAFAWFLINFRTLSSMLSDVVCACNAYRWMINNPDYQGTEITEQSERIQEYEDMYGGQEGRDVDDTVHTEVCAPCFFGMGIYVRVCILFCF